MYVKSMTAKNVVSRFVNYFQFKVSFRLSFSVDNGHVSLLALMIYKSSLISAPKFKCLKFTFTNFLINQKKLPI